MEKDADGYTKIPPHRRTNKKPIAIGPLGPTKTPSENNIFEALNSLPLNDYEFNHETPSTNNLKK